MTALFIFCAVFGAVILFAQVVLGMLSIESVHIHTAEGHEIGGHDHGVGHHDSTKEHTKDTAKSTLNLKSVRGLSAGLMMFGLTGGWLLSSGYSTLVTVVVGLVVGWLFNLGTAWAFSKIAKVESDGTPLFQDAENKVGVAYTTIPMSTKAPFTGRVQVSTGNGIVEMPAYTLPGLADIEIGSRVYVRRVVNGVAEVEQVN